MIATDHAPHTEEEKGREITKAPSGIIGLETALPLALMNLVNSDDPDMQAVVRPDAGTDIKTVLAALSTNPAVLYKLDAGYIKEGGPADIVIFDPAESWVFKKEDIASKACNSPFIGEKLTGRVKYTICKGKIAWRDE
jgi:dihydroorotase